MLKNNWRESCERYTAFWNNKPLDRSPVIFDSIGRWTNPMYQGVGYNYQKYGEDIESFCRDYEKVWEARADCQDDTIPCISPQMGGAIVAAMWAGEIEWGEEVANLIPHNPLERADRLDKVEFNPANKYFKRIIREIECLSSRSHGRFGVSLEASTSITTTLSQLRGGTRFMYDTSDIPEQLRTFAEKICDHFIMLQDKTRGIVPHPEGGSCHRWINYWNPGRGFWFSEDDAIMLSPEMYRDLFLDLDRRMCAATDFAAIHWHTGGLHLVGELLKIENLKMVQLSFDPGGPVFEKVLATCREIVAAGRKVCFQISFDENKIRRILGELDHNHCMFFFNHADSIKQADAIVKTIETMAKCSRRIKNSK